MGVLLLLPVLVLAACGAADQGSGDDDALVPPGDPVGELVVEQRADEGAGPQRWTLVCGDQATGDHPDAQTACDHLIGLDQPFAALPEDRMCTQQFGGPQTATVTGVWRGEPVDLSLARSDGCLIEQWDRLGPLLPGPVGVDPPG